MKQKAKGVRVPSDYPDDIDDFTNPTQGQSRSAAGVEEWLLFANLNDAVEAIETELGVNPAGSFDSVGSRLDGTRPYFSDTEPDGDVYPLWFDTTSGILYLWYSSAATPTWVEI